MKPFGQDLGLQISLCQLGKDPKLYRTKQGLGTPKAQTQLHNFLGSQITHRFASNRWGDIKSSLGTRQELALTSRQLHQSHRL